jgi:hypothetical protein
MAHGSYGDSNTAVSAVSNLGADVDVIVEQGKADKEIVILDVEDMSSSDKSDWWHRCPVCAAVFTNKEEGTDHMDRPCDPPDSDDLGDGFPCETCNTVFDTEKSNFAQKIPETKQQGCRAAQRVQFQTREPPLRPTQDSKRRSRRLESSPPPPIMDAKWIEIAMNPRQVISQIQRSSAKMMTTRTRNAALSGAQSHTQNLATGW